MKKALDIKSLSSANKLMSYILTNIYVHKYMNSGTCEQKFRPLTVLSSGFFIRFDPDKTFGMKTHSDPRGVLARKALNWFTEDQAKFHTPVMSQRQFDFIERNQYKLGKVRDP